MAGAAVHSDDPLWVRLAALWPQLTERDRRSVASMCDQLEGRWRHASKLAPVDVGDQGGTLMRPQLLAATGLTSHQLERLERVHNPVPGRETVAGQVLYPVDAFNAWAHTHRLKVPSVSATLVVGVPPALPGVPHLPGRPQEQPDA